jgi:signal transduction histidine kinase
VTYGELIGIAVLGLTSAVAGLALVARSKAKVPGSALALGGLCLLVGAILQRPGSDDLAALFMTAGAALLLPVAVTTYPRPEWRHPVDFIALVTVLGCGLLAVGSGAIIGWWERSQAISPSGTTLVVVVLLHIWWKLERADAADRRALVWLVLSLVVPGTVLFFVAFALEGVNGQEEAAGAALGACFALMGAVGPAMYVGLRRPEVVDVRGLVVKATVLLTAVIAYMAVYATIEGVLNLVGNGPPSVGTMALAAALIAPFFHPLEVAMRGIIDELLFGRRPDPLGAAGHVAESIGDDPALALGAIREALVLPFAELRIDGRAIATSGTEVTHTRALPLALGSERAAELVVGLRPGDLSLTDGDQRVLDLARPLLAQSLRAQLLAEDLQESREQTVTALEEERRRLRRDLHDGLGPRLSGIAFTSDAARNTLRDDPDQADDLLRSLRGETATAIQEIRQLVYGMRPPALDELGLVPALRQQVDQLRTPDARPMRVALDAGDLPPLSAAVEVAAYRITVEALTNSARHSGSDEAMATLAVRDDSLVIEVSDRGRSNGEWKQGVGLSSMRERAAELGGTLSFEGGLVRAVLPLGTPTG